jgi:hypothetical protein
VSRVKSMPTRRARWENGRTRALCVTLGGSSVGRQRGCALATSYAAGSAWQQHNDFLWAKILLLHAENLFIDFGAES